MIVALQFLTHRVRTALTMRMLYRHVKSQPARLAKQQASRTSAVPTAMIEAFVCPPQYLDAEVIARRYLYLDDDAITAHFSQFSKKIGAIDNHWATRFSLGIARRLSQRLGKRFADRLGVPEDALTDAWFFPIWSELCTLIPARHLAKRLARKAAGKPVLITLPPQVIWYLPYWGTNRLLPFYIAAALQRLGTPVAFVCTDSAQLAAAQTEGSICLQFKPAGGWGLPFSADPDCMTSTPLGQFLAGMGIRGLDRIHAGLAAPIRIPSGSALAEQSYAARTLQIKVGAAKASGRHLIAKYLSKTLPYADLAEWLVTAIGEKTKEAAVRAAELVSRHKSAEAHICDHLFFESAMIAHAVRSAGGKVVLWPHSSNAVHVEARRVGSLDVIHCLTQSAASKWKSRFPDVPCEVNSELMLQACSGPRPLDPASPLTVVVIGGGHSLGRLPTLDQERHTVSYRRLFAGLADRASGMRVILKPKTTWESSEWFQSLIGPHATIQETMDAPSDIDAPNLIYISVSFGSTALLEGLGRGIPCMIVRDCPIEDYTAFDPDNFPIGGTNLILSELRRCRDDFAYLEAMTERQLEWYRRETNFSSHSIA